MSEVYECDVFLNTVDKVKEFIKIVSLYNLIIDATSEKYVVDGNSILGILSLNLMKPINLRITGDQNEIRELVSKISDYLI